MPRWPDKNAPPVPTSDAAALVSGAKPKRTHSPHLIEKERQARQSMVLMRTVCGEKAAEIAADLKLKVSTVRADLQAARRSDLLLAAQDRVQSMIPKAIAVLELWLERGDKDVALVVLEGLGVIGKHVQIVMAPSAPGAGTQTFEEFRRRVTITTGATSDSQSSSANPPANHPGSQLPPGEGQVIDAQVTEVTGLGADEGVVEAHHETGTGDTP